MNEFRLFCNLLSITNSFFSIVLFYQRLFELLYKFLFHCFLVMFITLLVRKTNELLSCSTLLTRNLLKSLSILTIITELLKVNMFIFCYTLLGLIFSSLWSTKNFLIHLKEKNKACLSRNL